MLTVYDLDKTCEFYTRVLGMEVIDFDNKRKALRFGQQKINLHQAGQEFEPKALNPTSGAGDICLITTIPLQQVIEHLHSCQVTIVSGPVRRTGALGQIESVYVRDPDGNLIEVANYLDKSGNRPQVAIARNLLPDSMTG